MLPPAMNPPPAKSSGAPILRSTRGPMTGPTVAITMARMVKAPPIAARDQPRSSVIGPTNTPIPTPPMPIPTPAPMSDVATIHQP